jgi:hypothetical protein
VNVKLCTACENPKSVDSFSTDNHKPDGKRSHCKLCVSEYRKRNRKRINLNHSKWYTSNPQYLSIPKRLVRFAKARAKRFGVPFSITENDIIVPDKCPVLNIPIDLKHRSRSDNSPSLDRIIPSEGYVPGNVAVISYRANRIKNNGTAHDHRLIADWMDLQRLKG